MTVDRVLETLHGLVVEDVSFPVVHLRGEAWVESTTVVRRVRWTCRGCGRERKTFVHTGGKPLTTAEVERDLGRIGVTVLCEEYSSARLSREFFGLAVVSCGLCPAAVVLSTHARWRIGYEHGRRDVLEAMEASTYEHRVRAIQRLSDSERDFVPMLPVAVTDGEPNTIG